ncbi:hypothetical protein TNCV_169661 [Trichonephila clavipes]|nr:hypothetical protein TNCV_169661 [Trichonephila clavipes]
MLWGGKLLVETILRQTRTPSLTEEWAKWPQQLLDNVVQTRKHHGHEEISPRDIEGSENAAVPANSKLKSGVIPKMKTRSRVCVNYRADPLNSLGGALLRPQSPLIGESNRSIQGFPYFSLTPLVLGDNRPARLISTQTRTGQHSSPFKSFVDHMCEEETNIMEAVHRSFVLIERGDFVWMSAKEKVWHHQSHFPNRLKFVMPLGMRKE